VTAVLVETLTSEWREPGAHPLVLGNTGMVRMPLILLLPTVDLHVHAITENVHMEWLVREVGAVVQRNLGNNKNVDDVVYKQHEKLLLRNESTKKVVVEYREEASSA
jgi:hypothetical protein